MCMDQSGSVNAWQSQIAGTLDQLSKHQANCQFLNHWLVEKLIRMDRQMEKGVEEEEKGEEEDK